MGHCIKYEHTNLKYLFVHRSPGYVKTFNSGYL